MGNRRVANGMLAAVMVTAAVRAAGGGVVHVDADAPPGGDGAVWATAFADLQDALDLAVADPSVNEIWVAEGVYRPDRGTAARSLSFRLINLVGVYGGFAGDEQSLDKHDPETFVTVLSGDLQGDDGPDFTNVGDNSYHVVDADNTNAGSILDGFTITGGNADGPCCTADRGGAVISQFGATTIRGCRVRANRALNGGAIFYERQSAVIVDCVFEDNLAVETGGAVYVRFGGPRFEGCLFAGNRADQGGALHVDESGPELDGCTFSENAARLGGAVYHRNGSTTLATGTLFSGNTAAEPNSTGGGGVFNLQSSPVFVGCTFLANFALGIEAFAQGGGTLHNDESTVELIDCELAFNFGGGGGAIRDVDESSTTLVDCHVHDNLAYGNGAGVASDESALFISGGQFDENFAQSVGGVLAITDALAIEIVGASFTSNGSDDEGGAIRIAFPSAEFLIDDCTFTGNAGLSGGAVWARAVGTVSGCVFRENRAAEGGGGLHLVDLDPVTVRTCRFEGNVADGVPGNGGGLLADNGDLVADTCLFVGNTAVRGGGLAITGGGERHVSNCTVVSNVAEEGGGVWVQNGAVLHSGILWDNRSDARPTEEQQLFVTSPVPVAVSFSCVEGLAGLEGPGNIGADPQLVRLPDDGGDGWGVGGNDDYGDVHLAPSSPCVNGGDFLVIPPPDAVDIDGEPRRQLCRLDMGADESPYFAADCNGNGDPDACDIEEGLDTDCDSNGVPDACDDDCNGNGVADACDIDQGTSEDCNANGVPDECDLAAGTSDDCNSNDRPDECDIIPVELHLESPAFTPFGFGEPVVHAFESPPAAGDPVTITFLASADLNSSSEFIDVELNGVFLGTFFQSGAGQCADPPSVAQHVLEAAAFNDLVKGGDAVFTVTASSSVFINDCNGLSFLVVTLDYGPAEPNDVDGDGVLDQCFCAADCAEPPDGQIDVLDLTAVILAWGQAGGPCDVDFDGIVGVDDLVQVLLNWGVCE